MRLSINGRKRSVPDHLKQQRLLYTLREHFGLVGAKASCGIGVCGACTVHMNGHPVRSCVTSTGEAEGAEIITIEGLAAPGGELHPLQQAWIDERVPQCGFCQAGQIMQAAALLGRNPRPSEADVVAAMAGNLCRCGTYDRIKKAIRRAASVLGERPAANTPSRRNQGNG